MAELLPDCQQHIRYAGNERIEFSGIIEAKTCFSSVVYGYSLLDFLLWKSLLILIILGEGSLLRRLVGSSQMPTKNSSAEYHLIEANSMEEVAKIARYSDTNLAGGHSEKSLPRMRLFDGQNRLSQLQKRERCIDTKTED